MEVDLPSMRMLDPNKLKRQVSRNAEGNENKRRFFGQQYYDDVATDIVKTFLPLMRDCNGHKQHMLVKRFRGRNSRGERDDRMQAWFVGQMLNGTGPRGYKLNDVRNADGYEGDGEQPRMYRLTFQVFDRHGSIPIRRLMHDSNVPERLDVPCGLSPSLFYNQLVGISAAWMNLVMDNFRLGTVPADEMEFQSGAQPLATVVER